MTTQPPPSYLVATGPQLPPPVFHYGRQQRKYLSQIRTTAVIHLIAGTLLVLLGIVAIILWAHWSYFSTPIWSGIVIYGLTGIIGLWTSSTQTRSKAGGYITMSVIAAAMSCALIVMYSIAAAEEQSWYYSSWACQPGGYWTWISNCHKSEAARTTFDSFITITAFFELIVSIISASISSCFACNCCKSCCGDACNCCAPSPPTTTAMLANNSGVFATTGHGLQQNGGVILQAAPQATRQPTAMYIVQQAPNPSYPQNAPLQQVAYPYMTSSPNQQVPAPYQVAPAPPTQQQVGMGQPGRPVVVTAVPPTQAPSYYTGPQTAQMPAVHQHYPTAHQRV